jgi:hypothetical protein
MTASEFLEAKANERDRFELELSDAFDVKASIVLLILTFLGTTAATVLTADKIANAPKLAQVPVIALILISGMFCVLSLWPKYYLLDDLPETYIGWLSSLEKPGPEQTETVVELSLELANRRIAHNHVLNETKSWALNRAFWSMALALLVEVAAITLVAFSSRPS